MLGSAPWQESTRLPSFHLQLVLYLVGTKHVLTGMSVWSLSIQCPYAGLQKDWRAPIILFTFRVSQTIFYPVSFFFFKLRSFFPVNFPSKINSLYWKVNCVSFLDLFIPGHSPTWKVSPRQEGESWYHLYQQALSYHPFLAELISFMSESLRCRSWFLLTKSYVFKGQFGNFPEFHA